MFPLRAITTWSSWILVAVHVAWTLMKHSRACLRCVSHIRRYFLKAIHPRSDPLARKIRELVVQRRMQQCRSRVVVISHVSVLFLLSLLVVRHVEDDLVSEDIEWTTIGVAVLLCPCLAVNLFGHLITYRFTDAIHASLIALMLAYKCYWPRWNLNKCLLNVAPRVALLCMFENIYVTNLLNLVSTVATVAVMYGGQDMLLWEFFGSVFVAGLSSVLHSSTYSAAEASLETKISVRSEASVHQLLSSVCDAVVSLGPDFTIQHPSPKLSALMFKPTSATALLGTAFQDHLLDTEREQFCSQVSTAAIEHLAAADHEGIACTMHAHMRDTNGNAFAVQLFHSAYLGFDDQWCYIVGIREDSEGRREAALPQDGLAALPKFDYVRSRGPPSGDASETSSSSSNESAPVAVWIDMAHPNYQVHGKTIGFVALAGPSSPCTELKTWIGRSEFREFVAWAQDTHNALLHGVGTSAPYVGLDLRPPHLRRHNVCVRVSVEMTLAKEEESGEAFHTGSDDEVVVQLIFRDLAWRSGKESSSKRSSGRPQRGTNPPVTAVSSLATKHSPLKQQPPTKQTCGSNRSNQSTHVASI